MSNIVDALAHGHTGRRPSFEAIQVELRAYFQQQLNKSLELSHDLPDDVQVDLDAEINGLNELVEKLRIELARQRFTPADRADAEDILAALGGHARGDSDEMRTACNGVLRAKIEGARILAAMLSGRHDLASSKDPLFAGLVPNDLPDIPGHRGAPRAPSATLGSVVQQYRAFKSRGTWTRKTAADQERVFKLAFEMIGRDTQMSAVRLDDVRTMRDALASLPKNYMKMSATRSLTAREAMALEVGSADALSLKTQDKYFSMFRSLLIWSANEGIIDSAPGRGVKVASVGRINPADRRLPYTPEQLQKLFSSPLYRGHDECHRNRPGSVVVRDGRFWIPLIALFSGMRMGEIIQLLSSDVKGEAGIWYFDVSTEGGKTLKTASSRRKVPVHPILVEAGLLRLKATLPAKIRLFSDIEHGADGSPSHNFSKWWTRYSRQAAFAAPKTCFHSFRHSFKDALVASEVSEYVAKALLGHSDRSAHSTYGSGPPLSQLKAAVDRVGYSVDVSFLKA